jgi:hypothetical protein
VYYLAVKNLPSLFQIFPKFAFFGTIALVSSVRCAWDLWMHGKGLPALGLEIDISAEASLYNYRLLPGYI